MKAFFIALGLVLTVGSPVAAHAADEAQLRAALIELIERLQIAVQVSTDTASIHEAAPMVAGVSTSALGTNAPAQPIHQVIIEGEVVFTGTPTNRSAALNQCEGFAYDTDYMWQQVECVYDGSLIYSGVFVAG